MYLLPILQRSLSPIITQYWLFLERNGTHLMEIDATPETVGAAVEEFLEANELSLSGAYRLSPDGQIAFVPVDPTDPDLAAFYSWSDILPGATPLKEVWRPFLWNTDSGETLGTNRLLGDIPLAPPNHTVFSVLEAFCAAATVC